MTTTATLTVSALSSAGTTSRFVLQEGRRYLLRSTGYYRYGPGNQLADAECALHPDGSWQRLSPWEQDGPQGRGHLDLMVQGRATRWVPVAAASPEAPAAASPEAPAAVGAACASTTHTYTTVLVPGRTERLRLRLSDDGYTDNGGGLRVTITPLGTGLRR